MFLSLTPCGETSLALRAPQEYTFSSIDKSEKSALYDYIESKGIEIIDTSGGRLRLGRVG